jgi:hypothetical protein
MPQQLNLLDPGLLPPKRRLTAGPFVLLLALAYGAVAAHALAVRGELALALQLDTPAPEAVEAAPADAGLQALQQRVDGNERLLAALGGERPAPAAPGELLAAVVQALPQAVWLAELEWHAAGGLRVHGGTLDPQALTAFSHRLAAVPALAGLPIATVRLEPRVVDDDGATAADGAARPPVVPAHWYTLVAGTLAAAPAAPNR